MELKKLDGLWDNWYVKDFIGEGSFGKVYIIERREFDDVYTAALKHIKIPQNPSEIKVLSLDGMTDEDIKAYYRSFVKDIVKEYRLMSELKGNSNIVSYEDHKCIESSDSIGWDIFIKMELLTPLYDYIKSRDITKRDIIQLGIDMCKALEVCQRYNIIHRDVKPENIFVSRNGDYKLGDFGIARTMEKTVADMSKKGTYTYIAPEIYMGREYGANVDIYSLGIVMYRLLNNNRAPLMPPYPQPISHTDSENALFRRLNGEPLPPPANSDGKLSEIVLKACAYNPMYRYDSPTRMREDLEAVMYNQREAAVMYPDGDVNPIPNAVYVSTKNNIQYNGQNYSRGSGQGYGQSNSQGYAQGNNQSYAQNNGQNFVQNNSFDDFRTVSLVEGNTYNGSGNIQGYNNQSSAPDFNSTQNNMGYNSRSGAQGFNGTPNNAGYNAQGSMYNTANNIPMSASFDDDFARTRGLENIPGAMSQNNSAQGFNSSQNNIGYNNQSSAPDFNSTQNNMGYNNQGSSQNFNGSQNNAGYNAQGGMYNTANNIPMPTSIDEDYTKTMPIAGAQSGSGQSFNSSQNNVGYKNQGSPQNFNGLQNSGGFNNQGSAPGGSQSSAGYNPQNGMGNTANNIPMSASVDEDYTRTMPIAGAQNSSATDSSQNNTGYSNQSSGAGYSNSQNKGGYNSQSTSSSSADDSEYKEKLNTYESVKKTINETRFNSSNMHILDSAMASLEKLDSFKDSKDLYNHCIQLKKEIKEKTKKIIIGSIAGVVALVCIISGILIGTADPLKNPKKRLELAGDVYGFVNTTLVNHKAVKGNYPTGEDFLDTLNSSSDLLDLKKEAKRYDDFSVAFDLDEKNKAPAHIGFRVNEDYYIFETYNNDYPNEMLQEYVYIEAPYYYTDGSTWSYVKGSDDDAAIGDTLEKRLEIAKAIYQFANTVMINHKASNGNWPVGDELVQALNTSILDIGLDAEFSDNFTAVFDLDEASNGTIVHIGLYIDGSYYIYDWKAGDYSETIEGISTPYYIIDGSNTWKFMP